MAAILLQYVEGTGGVPRQEKTQDHKRPIPDRQAGATACHVRAFGGEPQRSL